MGWIVAAQGVLCEGSPLLVFMILSPIVIAPARLIIHTDVTSNVTLAEDRRFHFQDGKVIVWCMSVVP